MIYGNKFLKEDYGYVDEQLLQEMHFTKKDLQDPATLKR